MTDQLEAIARQYVEGLGGLFDLYRYEMASPLCTPPEVEGARWMLKCLLNPENRETLLQIMEQAELRRLNPAEPERLIVTDVWTPEQEKNLAAWYDAETKAIEEEAGT